MWHRTYQVLNIGNVEWNIGKARQGGVWSDRKGQGGASSVGQGKAKQGKTKQGGQSKARQVKSMIGQ